MSEESAISANPYVGPRPFEQSESKFFYGRDKESEILTGMVMAHQASLFFAQSGAVFLGTRRKRCSDAGAQPHGAASSHVPRRPPQDRIPRR